ncbi:MAG: cell division protein FtsH, partial [Endomicrobium sp.]|nr:cell division protein FtsH [Endomicrobium sp.]
KSELLDRLAILFGGRVAEEVMFSEITTGAQNDISKATEIATRMVMEFGMSEKVGPMALQRPNEEVFLGRDISREVRHSGKTSELIDEEIKKIIDGAKSKATKLIKDNSAVLDKLVKYLLERENLNGEEVDKIIKGEELPPVAEKVPVTEEDRKEASVEKEVIKEKIDGGQQKSEKI